MVRTLKGGKTSTFCQLESCWLSYTVHLFHNKKEKRKNEEHTKTKTKKKKKKRKNEEHTITRA